MGVIAIMRNVDIQVPDSMISAMGLTPQMIQGKIAVMITLARNHLLFQAQRKLHSSASQYIGGISPGQLGGYEAQFHLVGRFPNMLEWGSSAFDLRETILGRSSRSVKTSKAGFRYASVPFRHMGEGTTGRNGYPLGSRYAKVVGKAEARRITGMVISELNRIKSMNPSGEVATRQLMSGARISSSSGGPLLRARHATGLYSGMVIISKTYDSGAKSSQLMTFRTISNNPATMRADSGGMNWLHPGLVPRRFLEKTQKYIRDMAPTILGAEGAGR